LPVHPWILAATSSKNSGGGSGFLLVVVASVVLMVVLFRRSQRTTRRRAADLQSTIAVGERVITTAGIHATVVATDESTIDLEIADGVVVTFAKAAVTRVIPAAEEEQAQDDEVEDVDEVEEEPVSAEEQQGDAEKSASES